MYLVKGRSKEDQFTRLLESILGPEGTHYADTDDKAVPAGVTAAVLLSDEADRRIRELAQWAWDAKLPSITVCFRNGEIQVGPFSVPGRRGCAHCASVRLECASSASGAANVVDDACFREAAELVAGELLLYSGEGLKGCTLLDRAAFVRPGADGVSVCQFLALPRCEVCGSGTTGIERKPEVSFSEDDEPGMVLASLACCLDSRMGIVSQIVVEAFEDTGLDLPIVATAAPPRVLQGCEVRTLPSGWGKGLTLTGAILSAVGEAVERYAPSIPDPARIRWCRMEQLAGDVLDPHELPLYSDDQYQRAEFPFTPFNVNEEYPWSQASWLEGGGPVWVPSSLAFLSMDLRREQVICQGTSNGLAASTSADDSKLRAVLELIERDAFMAAWLTASPGLRMELDATLDPRLATVLAGIESFGARVELYQLPTTVIGSAVVALAFGDGLSYPGVTIGLGADLDVAGALRQAILELGQTGPYLRRIMQMGLVKSPDSPGGVRAMLDHAAYYFRAERAGAFDWLRGKSPGVALRDLAGGGAKRSLQNVALCLKGKGIRVALLDVTSRDLESTPFHVYRALSPDLQPITYGYGLDRLPVARVRKLGLNWNIPEVHPIW